MWTVVVEDWLCKMAISSSTGMTNVKVLYFQDRLAVHWSSDALKNHPRTVADELGEQ